MCRDKACQASLPPWSMRSVQSRPPVILQLFYSRACKRHLHPTNPGRKQPIHRFRSASHSAQVQAIGFSLFHPPPCPCPFGRTPPRCPVPHRATRFRSDIRQKEPISTSARLDRCFSSFLLDSCYTLASLKCLPTGSNSLFFLRSASPSNYSGAHPSPTSPPLTFIIYLTRIPIYSLPGALYLSTLTISLDERRPYP